jgi:hypothetical protein
MEQSGELLEVNTLKSTDQVQDGETTTKYMSSTRNSTQEPELPPIRSSAWPGVPAHERYTDAAIYINALQNLGMGYPIFIPEDEIHIGDVGLFFNRRFIRLFNILYDSEDHRNESWGVPMGYVMYRNFARKAGEGQLFDITVGRYGSGDLTGEGLARRIGTKKTTYVPTDLQILHADERRMSRDVAESMGSAGKVTYSLGKGTSAILAIHSAVGRIEMRDTDVLRRYVAESVDSWNSMARDRGFGEYLDPKGSVILVTGCDKVQSWESATLHCGAKDASVTFSADTSKPGCPTNLSRPFTTTGDLVVQWRSCRHKMPPSQFPIVDQLPPEYLYTVFARFYQIQYHRTVVDRLRGTRTVKISHGGNTTHHSLPKV